MEQLLNFWKLDKKSYDFTDNFIFKNLISDRTKTVDNAPGVLESAIRPSRVSEINPLDVIITLAISRNG